MQISPQAGVGSNLGSGGTFGTHAALDLQPPLGAHSPSQAVLLDLLVFLVLLQI